MNILFLGVGHDQIPAINIAKLLGCKVHGFDGNPEAEGKDRCDTFTALNIKDPNAVEAEAIKLNKRFPLDGCMAPAVEVGPSVGRVIDRFNLPGIGEKMARRMTNKVLRNEYLRDNGILIPNSAESASGWTRFPAVVKPKDQAAAVGVEYIESEKDLEGKAFDLIQEYIEGIEISTEVLVFKDNYIYINADRNYDKKMKYKPYLLEDGCQLPSKIPVHMNKSIDRLIQRLIRIFQLQNCAIKLDLIVKDNQVYVLEVAPRLGGGKLSSVMIPLFNGITWWRIAIELCLGLPISNIELGETLCVAQRYRFPDNPKSHKDRLEDSIEVGETTEEAIKKAEDKVNAKRD